MDKETELAYLKSLLASSQDIVNVLETIAAQFKSMEKSSQDMVTVFNNWSNVFTLASKPDCEDVSVIIVPNKKSTTETK